MIRLSATAVPSVSRSAAVWRRYSRAAVSAASYRGVVKRTASPSTMVRVPPVKPLALAQARETSSVTVSPSSVPLWTVTGTRGMSVGTAPVSFTACRSAASKSRLVTGMAPPSSRG